MEGLGESVLLRCLLSCPEEAQASVPTAFLYRGEFLTHTALLFLSQRSSSLKNPEAGLWLGLEGVESQLSCHFIHKDFPAYL